MYSEKPWLQTLCKSYVAASIASRLRQSFTNIYNARVTPVESLDLIEVCTYHDFWYRLFDVCQSHRAYERLTSKLCVNPIYIDSQFVVQTTQWGHMARHFGLHKYNTESWITSTQVQVEHFIPRTLPSFKTLTAEGPIRPFPTFNFCSTGHSFSITDRKLNYFELDWLVISE